MSAAELTAKWQELLDCFRDSPIAQYEREAIARHRRIDSRALCIRRKLAVSADFAERVAAFSLDGWAECYPVCAYDLGEDAALFVAAWLISRAVDDVDSMYIALDEWRLRRLAEELSMPPATRDVYTVDAACSLAKLVERAKAKTACAAWKMNRLARRAAASRRNR